jgi:F-type H+-transporting ATPase subunit delta
MKRLSAGVARRYGRALLDVALAQGEAVALRRELEAAATLLGKSADLRAAFGNRLLSAERKKKLVLTVWSESGASVIFRRLMSLLAERERLEFLPAIAAAYRALLLAHENIAAAEVVSAVALDRDQLAALEVALRKATGTGVEVDASLDPELLGGVLVRLGGRHYDGSVRGRLRALRASLAGA